MCNTLNASPFPIPPICHRTDIRKYRSQQQMLISYHPLPFLFSDVHSTYFSVPRKDESPATLSPYLGQRTGKLSVDIEPRSRCTYIHAYLQNKYTFSSSREHVPRWLETDILTVRAVKVYFLDTKQLGLPSIAVAAYLLVFFRHCRLICDVSHSFRIPRQ